MTGIFLKLLFKATVPVIALVGIMSYMMYMQGQDPLAPLKSVASGIGDQFNRTGRSVKSAASNFGDLTDSLASENNNDADTGGSNRRIYRWVNADGVIHFGTSKPESETRVTALDINPDENIMDSFKSPERPRSQVAAKMETVPTSGVMPISANPVKVKQMLQEASDLNAARLQQIENIR